MRHKRALCGGVGALILVAFGLMGAPASQAQAIDPPQRIGVDPDPPVAGDDCEVSYDFSGSGLTSATLTITYSKSDGSSETFDVDLTKDNPSDTITIPGDALTIIIEAPNSAGYSEIVS